MSSKAARMAYLKCSDEIKDKIIASKTISDVENLMAEFVQ